MLMSGGAFAANPDGPLAVEFSKRTLISGATLLANDIFPPSGATIIGVSNFVGGVASLTGGFPDVHWDDDGLAGLTPAAFDYTIQDNVNPAITSTTTVTLQPFYPLVIAVPDPSEGPAEEYTPFLIPKSNLLANDTYGGATSPPPNTANPVTVTVLQQDNPAYGLLFDSNVAGGAGLYIYIVPPGINNLEIECYGAEGGAGGDVGGSPLGYPGGLGGNRQITNLQTTPGEVLSIAAGGVGSKGAINLGNPFNFGSGGLPGVGYGSAPPHGVVGPWGTPGFGFPDGAGVPPKDGGIPGQQGGYGQEYKIPAGDPNAVGSGGGGGAGSAVDVGDININPTGFGPILCAAGGGGGGGGRPNLVPLPEQGPGRDGGPATNSGTGNDNPTIGVGIGGSKGRNGGSDIPNQGGDRNGRGGGGGGYRGGHTDAQSGADEAWGGENGDQRVSSLASGARAVVPSQWSRFSRSATIDNSFALQTGNGRVIIRGRWIADDLGGQQYPVDCTVVDLGVNIQVTPVGYTYLSSAICTFHYYLTDTVTGALSSPAQVTVSTQQTSLSAVNDGPYDILENSVNVAVDSVVNLISNDTFFTTPTFTVESFSGDVIATNTPGTNLRVTTGPYTPGGGSVTYRITDPNAPVLDGQVLATSTDTAVVTINTTAPSVAGNFNGGSAVEGTVISIPFVTFIGNSNGGTTGITFNNVVGGSQINCTTVVTGIGVDVTLGPANAFTSKACSFRYRMINGETPGRLSNEGTVSLTSTVPASWVTLLDTTTPGNGTSGSLPAIPAGKTKIEMRVDSWGADGGDGGVSNTSPPPTAVAGADGGAGGHGRLQTYGSPWAQAGFSFDYHVGQPGNNGSGSSLFVGGAGGLGGAGNAPGGFGYTGGGGATGGQGGSGQGAAEYRGGGGGGGGGSGVARSATIYAGVGGGGGGRGGGSSATDDGLEGGFGGGAPSSNGESGIDFTPVPSTTGLGGGGGGFSGGQTSSSASGTGGASQTAAEGGDSSTDLPIGSTVAYTDFSVSSPTTARVRIQYRFRE